MTLAWQDALPLAYLLGVAVTWIFMLRPLLPNPRPIGVALQITPASKPAIFELLDVARAAREMKSSSAPGSKVKKSRW